MSPRPRKVSDDEVFAAAHRATMRLAPADLTLAEIAKEAGVTASALAQRFGSKRALLLALSRAAAGSAGEFLRGLAASHRSPLAAIRAYAECMAGLAQSPAALARNLAYLQIDLADPEFREQLATQARATRAGFADLLRRAVEARELRPGVDVDALARTIEITISGALMTWACYDDEGPADRWMSGAVNAVLVPHLPRPRARRARSRRGDRA